MKNRVRWKAAGLSAALMLSFAAGVWADDGIQKVEAYLRKDFKVTLNGKKQNLEHTPLVYNGFSYLPVREMSRLLGAEITWDEAGKTIGIIRPTLTPAPTPAVSLRPSQTPPPVSTPTPLPSDDRDLQEIWDATPTEMKLEQIVRYQVTYQGRPASWLGNVYNGTIFVRVEDAALSGLTVSGLKLTQEKLTETPYVSIDLLRTHMTEQPFFRTEPGPLVYGETDPKKIEVIKNYLGSYSDITHEIRAMGNNTYRLLVEYPQFTGDGKWSYRILTLSPNNTANGWYISSASSSSLPGAFKTSTPTP